MFKIAFIIVLTSLMLFGCASFDYETRPFFSSKVDCGNGKRMMTQRLCDFDAWGY
jgi:hypothetical protein